MSSSAPRATPRRPSPSSEVRPHTVTTDKAAIYPPALAAVLPETIHRDGRAGQQAIERDHQHLKGRYLPMRGFKQAPAAQVVCAGHGFMRNLRDGFYRPGLAAGAPPISRAPRPMRPWDELIAVLQAA